MTLIVAASCPLRGPRVVDRETACRDRLLRWRTTLGHMNSAWQEMSEWLKEHAWKAKPSSDINRYRTTSLCSQFNSFPLQMLLDVTP
jgi:hypothetical protein